MPVQSYTDIIIMTKNAFFCVAKIKLDNSSGKFYLISLRTDHLERRSLDLSALPSVLTPMWTCFNWEATPLDLPRLLLFLPNTLSGTMERAV